MLIISKIITIRIICYKTYISNSSVNFKTTVYVYYVLYNICLT